MRVGIVNYGMGNLGSVRRALDELGVDAFIAESPGEILGAHRAVLPGVGAFSEGMSRLRQAGWDTALYKLVHDQGKPLLGICLGMQMLASAGEEGGNTIGLSFVEGSVRRLDRLGCHLRIPHVGWNELAYLEGEPIFADIPQQSDFYFVHSYAFEAVRDEHVIAFTSYGVRFAAGVRQGNVFGMQFHPEKSSRAGRQLLRNFLAYKPC